ncbi:cytochrome P450 [Tothia fuscella]|uniref:Cytochrome P450 n=1 Tax=Tothia fuscella TaxID=1048955 RepID=A0A9P4TXD2_9PEZI|nr:cytochrome P450 [Tothia fuscella]
MHPIPVAAAVFLFLAFILRSLYQKRTARKVRDDELPGPTLLPYIGRVHDLPIQYMWLKFKEWADIYGPIYKTEMLGAKFIVVSDERIAEELLVKRAKNFSDRPMVRSLFDSKSTHGSMEYLPLMGKNQYWARQRRATHASLTEAANAQYYGVVNHEVKRWLHRLITEPDKFCDTLEDMASKVMCTLTWDDPSLSEYNTKSAWGLLTQMSPAGPITNVMTPLWSLPLFMNPWKRAEIKRHDEQQAWWMERLQATRSKMEQGVQRPCFTRQYIENSKSQKLSGDYEVSSCLGMLALVGVFTVGGPLNYFLMSMVYHPEWLARCQKEIDEACGGRMPTLDDSAKLPTLRACIRETMRWKPNVPTGVAHEAEEDEYYRGYLIEKGTRILPLDWAFLRNPIKYPDPDNFRPERFLEPSWPTFQAPLTQYPTVKGMTSFGWGQRACLGQTLTQDEMLAACGAVCWGFNLTFKTNAVTGEEIHIPLNKSNSLLIVKPDPYEMAFVPRSEERKQEIIEQWLSADAKDAAERAEFANGAEKRRCM